MNFIKYYSFLFIFLVSLFCSYAQVNDIELPNVNNQIRLIMQPNFEVYVTKENKVYYDGKEVNVLQLKELIGEPTVEYPTMAYLNRQTHLFADISARYSLIDSIKTEISSVSNSYIIFRSNTKGTYRSNVKGIKHKLPLSFYDFSPTSYMKTRKEFKKQDSIRKLEEKLYPEMPPIPLPSDFDSFKPTVERAVYSVQKELVNEALVDKKYMCISISNNGWIIDGKEVSLSKNEMEVLFRTYNFIFIKYEKDLTYGNYIKFIELLQTIKPNFKKNNIYAEAIELSYQIQRLHKKVNINICN